MPKPKCRQWYWFNTIVAVELSPSRRAKIDEHITNCRSCRKSWQSFLLEEKKSRERAIARIIDILTWQIESNIADQKLDLEDGLVGVVLDKQALAKFANKLRAQEKTANTSVAIPIKVLSGA